MKAVVSEKLFGLRRDEERVSRGQARLHKHPDSEDRAEPREELTQATGDRLQG